MTGMFVEYLLGKGWTAPCISMLQTIVDPRARSSAYAVFQIVSTIVGSMSPIVIGPIVQHTGLDPERESD